MTDDLEERVERIEATLGIVRQGPPVDEINGTIIVEEFDTGVFGATVLIDEDGDVWFTDEEGEPLWDGRGIFLYRHEVERLAERAREVADDD